MVIQARWRLAVPSALLLEPARIAARAVVREQVDVELALERDHAAVHALRRLVVEELAGLERDVRVLA